MSQPEDRPAASTRTLELVVGGLIFLFGLAVVYDSLRIGIAWASDGPESGYFPFYIGVLILISSGTVIFRSWSNARLAARPFVGVGQLKLVLMLLVPSIVYVGFIELVGIYVASVLFIGFFMMWLGKYSLARTLPVAVGVMVAFFLVFEIWFKVPLPKGPLEALLGFG